MLDPPGGGGHSSSLMDGFLASRLDGTCFVGGRAHHLCEDLRDLRCQADRHRAVGGDDPAERAHRVAGVRLAVRVGDGIGRIIAYRDAAGIRVFDDRDARFGVVEGGAAGGVGVDVVVVGHFLAVVLHRLGDARGTRESVERGPLVWVFAVAQYAFAVPGAPDPEREAVRLGGHVVGQPGGHRHVVAGGVGEGFGRQLEAGGQVEAPSLQRGDDVRITRGRGHHGDALGVLGRGPDHGRAADVDLLDDLRLTGTGSQRLHEWIQVHDHELERRVAELGQLLDV